MCKNGVRGGGEEGALDGAVGIATDTEGVLYVAEAINRRISVFDQQGRVPARVRQGRRPDERRNGRRGLGYASAASVASPVRGPGALGAPQSG